METCQGKLQELQHEQASPPPYKLQSDFPLKYRNLMYDGWAAGGLLGRKGFNNNGIKRTEFQVLWIILINAHLSFDISSFFDV